MVIDVEKVKLNEKRVLLEKEREFFNKVILKIESLDGIEKKQWIDTLESIYHEEENKYKIAKRVLPFRYSVSEFVLRKMGIEDKLNELKTGKKGERKAKANTVLIDEVGKIIGLCVKKDRNRFIEMGDENNYTLKVSIPDVGLATFISESDYSEEMKTIINFSKDIGLGSRFLLYDMNLNNGISGKAIWGYPPLKEEGILIENLVMSYFFESEEMLVDDLLCHDMEKDISFKLDDSFDFVEMIKDSSYMEMFDISNPNYIFYSELTVNNFVYKIEGMRDDFFLDTFKPVIKKMALETGVSFDDIASKLLDKKLNMGEEFRKLSNFLEKKKEIGTAKHIK